MENSKGLKIDTKLLKLGMKFTMPVFFDDGENMFLARGLTLKAYHLAAITRWNILFVYTAGKLTTDSPDAGKTAIPVADAKEMSTYMKVEELADLEELPPV